MPFAARRDLPRNTQAGIEVHPFDLRGKSRRAANGIFQDTGLGIPAGERQRHESQKQKARKQHAP